MTTIQIQVEEEFVTALKKIAQTRNTTIEMIINEVMIDYLKDQSAHSKKYSFIGIGHSGKGNISTQVDSVLEKSANRREGWSFSE